MGTTVLQARPQGGLGVFHRLREPWVTWGVFRGDWYELDFEKCSSLEDHVRNVLLIYYYKMNHSKT